MTGDAKRMRSAGWGADGGPPRPRRGNRRVSLSALSGAFVTSARERLRYPGDALGSAGFLVLLLFIFGRLWTAIAGERGLPEGWTIQRLVFYLLITELVVLAPGALHLRVARDVRSGDLAIQLLRPVGWVEWELARAAGASLARLLVLAAVGVPTVALMVGLPPLDARGVALGLLVIPLAIFFECVARLAIGVSAFWLEDSNALSWIWSKLAFILGGLLMPLDLYPQWLRTIAHWLPFEAVIFGPARMMAAFDAQAATGMALRLVLWLVLFLLGLFAFHARASLSVQSNGG